MDPVRFDTLVTSPSAPATRRSLSRWLAGLPIAGTLAVLWDADAAAATRPIDRVRARAHR